MVGGVHEKKIKCGGGSGEKKWGGGASAKKKMCGGHPGCFPVRPPLRISNGIALSNEWTADIVVQEGPC